MGVANPSIRCAWCFQFLSIAGSYRVTCLSGKRFRRRGQ